MAVLRVLHIMQGNIYGGVDTALISFARHRQSCGDLDQHFAYCFPGRFQRELQDTGADLICLGEVRLSRVWTILRARRRFRKLLSQTAYDFIICHSPWAMIVFGAVSNRKETKLIFWLHDLPLGRHWIGSVRGLLEQLAKRVRPDFVICNSHFTSQHLSDQYAGVESRVIYGGIDLRDVRSNRRASIRSELGAIHDTVVIIQVARMVSWKGHLPHLRALVAIKELPTWQCWFVGGAQTPDEAKYMADLKRFADLNGIGDRVLFLGQRDDVPDLMEAADIFCQPNVRPEPFGSVFVEALNASLPIIAAATGGAKELVSPDCGMLVTPADPAALVDVLSRLVQDAGLRESLSRSGPDRAKKLCAPEDRLDELHQTLVGLTNRAATAAGRGPVTSGVAAQP